MSQVVPEAPKRIRAKKLVAQPPPAAAPAPVCVPPPETAPQPPVKAAAPPSPPLIEWDGAFFSKVRERNPEPFVQERLQRRLSHDMCRRCQENYRKKFPGRPFSIECQGIYSEPDFQEIAQITGLSYEEAREALDIAYWASRHVSLPNGDGDLEPFQAREYQLEALWCTSRRQVDRWGRGLGKTTTGVIRELHTALNRKRYEILVACPMKAQAQKWYDEINKLIDNDPDLKEAVVQRKQAPYFLIRFDNNSTIAIFTTGSKSGADADSVRSQSPKRVRIDEQDMLNPGDYKAIMPLLRRYPKESEFHGSSTPVGKREDFWAMCTQYEDYRELHFPISVHPEWSSEMEEACRRESRTELNYIHEWLAEFGDQEGGCFRAIHIDATLKDYRYPDCVYDPKKKYVMGIDWNGQGTGSRFRVVQYDPATHNRKTVDASMVNVSTEATMAEVFRLNRKWHCDYVYIDKGFGFVQDELIRKMADRSTHADDRRLVDVQTIDFGARLETNKLLVNREKSKYIEDNEMERPTKPFMVEGAVMAVEAGLVDLSRYDKVFEEQIRAYRVKNYTKNGWASTYISDVGDHDFDAWMLAMLGIEQHWGISHVEIRRAPASVSFVTAFGQGSLEGNGQNWPRTPESARSVAQKKGNVPGRTPTAQPLQQAIEGAKPAFVATNAYGAATSVVMRPGRTNPNTPMRGNIPSRTGSFQTPSRSTGLTPRGGMRRW